MTSVELNDEELELFRQLSKRADIYSAMLKAGINDLSHGSMTLHIDADGNLRKVETNVVSWAKHS